MKDLLAAYGCDDQVREAFEEALAQVDPDPSLLPARVVRVDRGSCLVMTDAGPLRASPYTVASRKAGLGDEPTTGDWVVVAPQPGSDTAILAVLPRRSFLARRAPEDSDRYEQAIAANIDVIAVTAGLDRPDSAGRIERTLTMVWESGALPVVVLTKADVARDLEASVETASRLALGADVLVTSAATGEGADELRSLARPNKTLAFLGPSGTGKSSLVNLLVGADVQKTGEVRALDQRGRHTTTSRELVPLPGGGVLLDTPGLRSLGVLDVGAGLATTFDDVEAAAALCRFRDCGHQGEPGCAVREAIGRGELDERRLASYRKLQRESERALRLEQSPAGAEARREWRNRYRRLIREAGPTRLDTRRQSHN